ncbi:MAG: MFS transporter [Vicinamibacterales bacterium]|nr:MFS transporter [Vicinamibacterales bacterium]
MSIAEQGPEAGDPASDAVPVTAARTPRPALVPVEMPPSGFVARTFDALGNSNFRLLYFGNVLQFASMQMQMLVRGVLVYHLTGSFAALGLVSLANAIPGLLFSPVGGVVADRAPKKMVIQAAQAYNVLNAAALAILAGIGMLRFEHLMISAALQGAVNSTMMPSRQAIIVDLVGREKLMNAIAINTSGQNLMQLVGPGLGGVLLALLNPAAAFWVMAGLYLLAVTCTVRLPKHPVFSFAGQGASTGAARRRPGGSFRDLLEGMRYVAADRTIRTLIAVNFLIVLATMPYTMMLPGFVHEVLHRGAAEQGMLMSISGIGALIGSLIIAAISGRNRGRMLLMVSAILAASLIAFAASTNYFVTMPIMLLIGATTATRQSLGMVLIQSYSADEYRGRVMSVWMMQYSLVAFGTFGVGVLAEWFGPQLAIGGLAASLAVTLIVVGAFVPRMRNMQ